VTLLDLAIEYGRINAEAAEQVALGGDRERALLVVMRHLVFGRPIRTEAAR
jgi:hypothetical protein